MQLPYNSLRCPHASSCEGSSTSVKTLDNAGYSEARFWGAEAMTEASKAKKKKVMPPVARARRKAEQPASLKPLRRSRPPAPPASSIELALDDVVAILGLPAKRARDEALDSLARRRREAEARVGTVKLS